MAGKPVKARINLSYAKPIANVQPFELPRQNIAQLYYNSALRRFLAGTTTRP